MVETATKTAKLHRHAGYVTHPIWSKEMFNNIRKLLIGLLSTIIVIAIGTSACTAVASPEAPAVSIPETVTTNYGNGMGTSVVDIASTNGNANQGGNGQSNSGQGNPASANGSGVPQANITEVSTVHGIVNSYDLVGMNLTLDDGTSLYIQLGSSRYNQSIGFAPQAGEGVTVNGFPGNQGLYSAISVTLDSTGQVFSFRDASGRPLWAGGSGNGGKP